MNSLPKHIAIIMDGNGRWAKARNRLRISGHRAGVESVRNVVKICGEKGVEVLTLFAFSSENWQRPQAEVNELMELFLIALQREVKKLHKNNVRLRIIGDTTAFKSNLQKKILDAEALTKNNDGLTLIIAANYGGRWDIAQATKQIAQLAIDGKIEPSRINPELIQSFLSLAELPEPDLFIRTSGEQRISNFLLWELAYTELYFTKCYWPDFGAEELEKALAFYKNRERRFGCISEQLV